MSAEILTDKPKTFTMTVSMNGLRLNIARPFSNLANTLNDNLKEENDGIIRIEAEHIQQEMDNLRQAIAMSFCVYNDDDKSFADMSDKAEEIPYFNPKEEEGD
jgi:hypothetical protein